MARSVLERRQTRGRNEMTALELIDVANQVLFIGLFAAVLWRALKHPSRAAWDTVLLFGSIAAVVVLARVGELLGLGEQPWLIGLILLLLAVAPYAMLRLVDDFSRTPRWMLLAGGPGLAIIGVLGFVIFGAAPQLYEIIAIAWFLGVGGYAALAFGRAAIASRGITKRRMTAVAIGTLLFIAAIVIGLADVLAETVDLAGLPQIIALFAAIAFFLGFAPPTWIRRAWREPDLRNFLERSIHLPTVTDERRAVVEIQNAAAGAFGAVGRVDRPGSPRAPDPALRESRGRVDRVPRRRIHRRDARSASSAGWSRSMLPRPIRSMPPSTSGTSPRRSSPRRSPPTSVGSVSCRSMPIVRRSSSRTTFGCSS